MSEAFWIVCVVAGAASLWVFFAHRTNVILQRQNRDLIKAVLSLAPAGAPTEPTPAAQVGVEMELTDREQVIAEAGNHRKREPAMSLRPMT